ncbi:penicillin-binding transpeptidase domain-containing protein [Streptomyces sp. NBC_01803]|uniref:penicillin-binding transpeptidase domain-containing protein n=1 Tax=Streptomyces sp. NBC_01803 TaxID=2975946 RepID=UPI002DD8BE51|nr:penicillin-binding transpeptidase domain-containing protein [Streptomyces sp. NBC_01803]WSA44429.1 penicillin-binding transpeptidase domain-containing protein [Streptomyces sp. NBC_01803]
MGNRVGRTTIFAAVAVVVALAVVAVLLLRGGGDEDDGPERARAGAERFLDAWAAGDLPEAAGLTDDPEAAQSLLESVGTNMRAESLVFEVADEVTEEEDGAFTVPFAATFGLEGLGEWSYDSSALLLPAGEGAEEWTVRWESALVHPELAEGQTLVLTAEEPERAAILAADGGELAGPSTVYDVSIWPARLTDPDAAYEVLERLDAGIDTEALAGRVEEAGPDQAVPVVTLRESVFDEHETALRGVEGLQFQEDTRPLAHAARSVVGVLDPDSGAGASGLQSRYDEQLAGTAAGAVVTADRESGEAVETLYEQESGEPGTPVRTTIELDVQRAAEAALADLGREGSIVAVRPSTGDVLAAADWPADGFARSLEGQLAPGSTFKVLTAAALLETGTGPGDVLGCPRYATVEGQRFENQGEFELGPGTTLHDAFTASCNTAFIDNLDRFDDDTLHRTARAFGIGAVWDVGAVTFDGSVPVPDSPNALAASLIGQGQVQTSPLVMASVAATVADGTFRQPRLVPDAVEERHEATAGLSPETIEALRTMMRDTVTDGSASALRDVAGEPHGKTGTAEFRTEEGELSTNAWMIGYLGERDVAFAVMLEDGGSGGRDAGPVAAAFLNGL